MDKFDVPLTADGLPLGKNGLPLGNFGNYNFEGERVYVVTLKTFEDNDSFYQDMESNGGPLHIPDRVITCTNRRPTERSVDYLMTADEAAAVSHDPRVAAVELNPEDLGLTIDQHSWVSTSTFSKTMALTGSEINWGLYRTRIKTNAANWGGGTPALPSAVEILSDTSGKNVDVVIMDGGLPWPNTLEYKQNPDGTGYNRMVSYNWLQSTGGTYLYTNNYSNAHQAHTSGTVAGNRQGFARDSNIYNLTYSDSMTYVKTFHVNKPVNPITGVKNPTVTNNSWGYSQSPSSYSSLKLNTSRIHYRGVDYYPTSGTAGSYVWADATIQTCKIPTQFGTRFPGRNASVDAAFIDAAKAGVIHIVSAGNSFFYIAKPSADPNADYNNYMVYNGSTIYYHRGSSPGAADEVVNSNYSLDNSPICVGAMGAVSTGTASSQTVNYVYGLAGGFTSLLKEDYKSEFSNLGPRLDVYAPGECVLSVINSTAYYSGVVDDPRIAQLGITDVVSKLGLDAGTSMSGPHVCGVIACLLEKHPRMTTKDVRDWLASMPQTLASTAGGSWDGTDAGSWEPTSNKNVLFLSSTRIKDADVGGYYPAPYPAVNASYRRTSGVVWPRPRTLVAYNNNVTLSMSSDVSNISNNGTAYITLTTTNIPNGTPVSYVIVGENTNVAVVGWIDGGVSGVYTASAAMTGSITVFSAAPNTGNRITTTGGGAGTRISITNNLIGPASLSNSTLPTIGTTDDGYWTLTLPFNITFNGTTYSTIYVGTNGYITFGGGTTSYSGLGATNPAFNKVMISADDLSCQRIYYGVEGSAPNRTYRVRWEGHNSFSGGILGNPDMVWEAVFYENTNNQIDVQMNVNSNVSPPSSASYNFDFTRIGNAPVTGTFTVNNNTATLPILISTTNQYKITVRTATYPVAYTSFTTNS